MLAELATSIDLQPGQFSAIDNLLTGEENLLLMADLHHLDRREGRRRAAALLERFDLVDAARKRPATYSGGMRRRLDLAMTLVGDPRIIFLDERGILTPTIMLLLFVYFFGGTLGAGLGDGAYIDYVAPGIIIMAVGSGCATTAINLCTDMSEGIIARFRTMAIARASVLTGQVLGSLIRTMISIGLIIGIALLVGFRPSAGPVAWIAALGVIALLTLAVTWMGVAFGLVGKTPAGANSLSLIFLLLAFTSSAFVRPDSMPAGVALVCRVPALHARHRHAARTNY